MNGNLGYRMWIVCGVAMVAAASCTRPAVTLDELKAYPLKAENGLLQRQEKGNTVLEMYYKPKALILQQELHGVTDEREKLKVNERLDSVDYFVMRLARHGKEIESSYAGNGDEFTEVVNYLSFEMGPDLYMVCERDTLPVEDVLYARSFGAAQATSVLVVFKSNLVKNSKDARVIFDDKLLGTGLSTFDFKNKYIQQIPELKESEL